MSRSTKPYLIRALHEWCIDSSYTPYLVVWVNERANVPQEYVENNEIVLNISYNATHDLDISNDAVSFSARFGGAPRAVWVPIGNVMSIFARETGEGMGFEVDLVDAPPPPRPVAVAPPVEEHDDGKIETPDASPSPLRSPGRPPLRIVK